MHTRRELSNYSEEELVRLLKYILMRRRDVFDSVLALQYFYEVMVVLVCKRNGLRTATTSQASRYWSGFQKLANVRNILAHDLVFCEDAFDDLRWLLMHDMFSKLAVEFLGDVRYVTQLEKDLDVLVTNGSSILYACNNSSVWFGESSVDVCKVIQELPVSVVEKYHTPFECMCDWLDKR